MAADCAGEFDQEVHGHIIPRSRRHWKWRREASILSYLLGEGTHPTLSDNVPNIALQAQLVELMFYCLNRLVTTKGADKTSGMTLPTEFIPERCAWYAQPILKE